MMALVQRFEGMGLALQASLNKAKIGIDASRCFDMVNYRFKHLSKIKEEE